MSGPVDQNEMVRRGIIQQIIMRLEDEFGKPPADLMAVRRCANTVAKAIAGDEWRTLADRAIRRWELG